MVNFTAVVLFVFFSSCIHYSQFALASALCLRAESHNKQYRFFFPICEVGEGRNVFYNIRGSPMLKI